MLQPGVICVQELASLMPVKHVFLAFISHLIKTINQE